MPHSKALQQFPLTVILCPAIKKKKSVRFYKTITTWFEESEQSIRSWQGYWNCQDSNENINLSVGRSNGQRRQQARTDGQCQQGKEILSKMH